MILSWVAMPLFFGQVGPHLKKFENPCYKT